MSLGIAQWFGFGPDGLVALIAKAVVGLHTGMIALAMYGDRHLTTDSRNGGE